MGKTLSPLETWLRTDCPVQEAKPYCGNLSILYLDITTVKKKIRFMEDQFNVKLNQYDLHISTYYSIVEKDTLYSATLRVELVDNGGLIASLLGATTFSTAQYPGNYKYAAIGKSLALVNALSSEYEQFGLNLNPKDESEEMIERRVSAAKHNRANETMQLIKKQVDKK